MGQGEFLHKAKAVKYSAVLLTSDDGTECETDRGLVHRNKNSLNENEARFIGRSIFSPHLWP